MNSFVFDEFLNSAKDVEEQTASGKLFQTEVAAAEKHLQLGYTLNVGTDRFKCDSACFSTF